MNLRCYCCGQGIGMTLALVTASDREVDRVFTMLPEHAKRAEGAVEIVKRSPPPKARKRTSHNQD